MALPDATRAPEAIISARESEVVVVTPAPGATTASQLAAACLARLAELFPAANVVIGIGGTCRDPRKNARSYAQAQRTTQALRRLGRTGTVSAFGDLGILRIVLQVPDLAELRSFAADALGPLSHEHLATLAVYLMENSHSPWYLLSDHHLVVRAQRGGRRSCGRRRCLEPG